MRYFGGTKLGAGGLVRAYGQSVSRCVDIAELTRCYPSVKIQIQVPYDSESAVRRRLQECGGEMLDCVYSEGVQLIINLKESQEAYLKESIQDLTSGNFLWVAL